jgi:hypothetical protein
MMNTFTRKGYGRIYVDKAENIDRVKAIIKELDEFELSYLPEKFIATFDEYPQLAYTHKFCDMDINKLTAMCWTHGIHIWCCDNGYQEYVATA